MYKVSDDVVQSFRWCWLCHSAYWHVVIIMRLCSLAAFLGINVCCRLSLYFYDDYCAVDFAEENIPWLWLLCLAVDYDAKYVCDCRCNNVLYFSRNILVVMAYWNHYLVLYKWWHYEDDRIYFSNCIIQNYSALLWISLIDCLITAVFINIVLWPRLEGGGGEAPSCRLPRSGGDESVACGL